MSYAGLGTANSNEELQATTVDPSLLEPRPRVNPALVAVAPAAPRPTGVLPPLPVRCGHPINIGTTDPRSMTVAAIDQENRYLLAYRSQCYGRTSPAPPELNAAIEARRSALLGAKRAKHETERKMKWYAVATIPGALIGAYAGHRTGRGAFPGAAVGAWANFVVLSTGFVLLGRVFGGGY